MSNKDTKPSMRGHGPRGMRRVGEKAKDFKGTVKKLSKYLMEYKISLVIVIIFAIGSTIFAIIGPKILGNATTEIFNGLMNKISGTGGIDFGKIGEIIILLIGLYGLSAVFSFIQGFTMSNIAQKLTYKLRNELTEKINRLPMRYFDKRTNGEVLSVFTNDIDTLNMGLNQSITQIITSICTLIGILVMMLSISVIMTFVTLCIVPIAVLIIKKIIGKSQKYFVAQQEYLGHVNGQVEEVYGGHNIVKVFNSEEKAINEFQDMNNQLYKARMAFTVPFRDNVPNNEFCRKCKLCFCCDTWWILSYKRKNNSWRYTKFYSIFKTIYTTDKSISTSF